MDPKYQREGEDSRESHEPSPSKRMRLLDDQFEEDPSTSVPPNVVRNGEDQTALHDSGAGDGGEVTTMAGLGSRTTSDDSQVEQSMEEEEEGEGDASPPSAAKHQDAVLFEKRLAELEAFKAKYGHCRVPQVWRENKRLGHWVATMRNLRKADRLSLDCARQLEAVGFVWCCRNVTATKGEKRKLVPWNERFEELKAFKEQFGHCNVPHKWPGNLKLSNWTYCQRSFHRHGKLNADKIARLESIGFEWSKQELTETSLDSFPGKKRKGPSSTHLELHQDESLPNEQHVPTLADHQQRLHPADILQSAVAQGSPVSTGLRDRLIDGGAAAVPLDQGFASDGGRASNRDHENKEGHDSASPLASVKERKSWHERFQELVAFKQVHGHCNVPWKWKENLPLFYWVRRMKDKKRANALSDEKVRMLDELGFEWVKGQNKEKERHRQHQLLMEQKQKELEEEREREGLQAAMGADPNTGTDLPHPVSEPGLMSSPFVYSFPAPPYGGNAAGAPYYGMYNSKLATSSNSTSASSGFSFDPSALGPDGVDLAMDTSTQHALYAHGDLGGTMHYMQGHDTEMKVDRAVEMEGMRSHEHSVMHHHHQRSVQGPMHHHHDVGETDAQGHAVHQHMVEVMHAGHIGMTGIGYSDGMAGHEDNDQVTHRHEHQHQDIVEASDHAQESHGGREVEE